jgi:hypothetical protein
MEKCITCRYSKQNLHLNCYYNTPVDISSHHFGSVRPIVDDNDFCSKWKIKKELER